MKVVGFATFFCFILPFCFSFRCISLKPFSLSDHPLKPIRVVRLYLVDESKMTIDEMKSELDLRGVDYEDCVSKQDLLERLRDTRTLGKADPNIFNKFNEMEDLDSQQMNELLDSDEVEEIKSKDGSLPGGMDPALMKALAADADISKMLRDPKMQEIMSAVMTGGPQGLQKYLSDPDALLLLDRLSKVIARTTKSS